MQQRRVATVKLKLRIDDGLLVRQMSRLWMKRRRVAVQLDLKHHRELWEDIEDLLISRSRRNEKRIPLKKMRAGLVESGKLES